MKNKIQLYYDEVTDIFAIVQGKTIYKYIGEYGENAELLSKLQNLNEWYKAKIHPKKFNGFKLIGEL